MKRTLLIVMVMTLFMCLLGVTAYASTIASGKCGDNVTWRLNSYGLLDIQGTGEMYDYDYSSKKYAPWITWSSSIKHVFIGSDVTNVGDYSFFLCSNLENLVIFSDVERIGELAFYGCSSLESVTIGIGVKIIETGAFYGCTNLQTVKLSENVTTIGSTAFYNCISLQSIEITGGVTSIGNGAFAECKGKVCIMV